MAIVNCFVRGCSGLAAPGRRALFRLNLPAGGSAGHSLQRLVAEGTAGRACPKPLAGANEAGVLFKLPSRP